MRSLLHFARRVFAQPIGTERHAHLSLLIALVVGLLMPSMCIAAAFPRTFGSTLLTFPAPSGGVATVLDDFDGDGLRDCAVLHSMNHSPLISLYKGLGDGTFEWQRSISSPAGAFEPCALVVGDFDEDNSDDLVMITYGQAWTYHHSDGFTFTGPQGWVIPAFVRNVLVDDFDGDGHLDLATSRYGDLCLCRGNGSGGFPTTSSLSTGTNIRALASGDLDGDGRADIVTIGYQTAPPQLFHNAGGGAFTPVWPSPSLDLPNMPANIAIVPVDDDAHADIVVGYFFRSEFSVFFGEGGDMFSTRVDLPVPAVSSASAAADVDHDGRVDLVALDPAQGRIAWLRGDGTRLPAAQPVTQGTVPDAAFAFGDLSGDGRPEIVFAAPVVAVAVANANGTFGSPSDEQPKTSDAQHGDYVVAADVNADGFADLLAFNSVNAPNADSLSYFPGDGSGQFTETLLELPGLPWSAVAGRFDTDSFGDAALLFGFTGEIALLRGASYGPHVTDSIVTRTDAWDLRTADVDADGFADLLALGVDGVRLHFGNAAGSFERTRSVPLAQSLDDVEVADLDEDGWPDLIAIDDVSQAVVVALGLGRGMFAPAQTLLVLPSPWSLAVADFDADGHLDLGVDDEDGFRVLTGDGALGFRQGQAVSAVGAPVVADLNGDGYPDLECRGYVLLNTGTGSFGTIVGYGVHGDDCYQLVDIDADGRLDLASSYFRRVIAPWITDRWPGLARQQRLRDGPASAGIRALTPERDAARKLENAYGYITVQRNVSDDAGGIPAPGGLHATILDCGLTTRLDWSYPPFPISGFEVQVRRVQTGDSYTAMASLPPGVHSFTDQRADGFTRLYRIVARAGTASSPASNPVRAGYAAYDPTRLPAPAGVVAKSVGDGLTLRLRVSPPRGSTSWEGLASVVIETCTDGAFVTPADSSFAIELDDDNRVVCSLRNALGTSAGTEIFVRARLRDVCGFLGAPSDPIRITPRHAPIVFVHGICGDGSDWDNGDWNWPGELASRGLDRSLVLSFVDKDDSWTAWVDPLYDRIREKLANEWVSDEKVDIVAYSQGGLASRGVIEKREHGAELVRTLVMLGTPNHGGMFSTAAQMVASIPNWKCQTKWPHGARGLPDLVGGCPSLNDLNYGSNPPGDEQSATESCDGHEWEGGSTWYDSGGPMHVAYWTVAGTSAIEPSALLWLFSERLLSCFSDGVVPASSVWLTRLDASHQFWDLDLPGVGFLSHTGLVGPLGSTPIQQSRPLARHVGDILLGSPPQLNRPARSCPPPPRPADGIAQTEPVQLVAALLDTLVPGSEVTRTVAIDDCDSMCVVAMWPDSTLTLAIRDPNGVLHTAADAASDPDLYYEASPELGFAAFRVRAPLSGPWTAVVSGNASSVPVPLMTGWGVTNTRYSAEVSSHAGVLNAGNSTTVSCQLFFDGNAVPAQVDGELQSPSGTVTSCLFRDDGFEADLTAGDLMYSARVVVGAEDGAWTVRARAMHAEGDSAVATRTGAVQLAVVNSPSVAIVAGSFASTLAEASLGAHVGLTARVCNTGNSIEPELHVEFWDRSTGHMIASLLRSVPASETTTVAVDWQPTDGGIHQLELLAYSPGVGESSVPARIRVVVNAGGLLSAPVVDGRRTNFLAPPAPTPFSGRTRIDFTLAAAGRLQLEVVDIGGRRVRRIADGYRRSGAGVEYWSGTDDGGGRLPPGVYFVVMRAPGIRLTRRTVLLR